MRLNQVTLRATDLARSVSFYKLLGLRLIVDALPRYVRFEVPSDNQTLSLEQVESPPASDGAVIYFECDDLDERVKALKQKGLVFDSGPRDESWLWREARLKDPDGNEICLYHAGSNRRFPPWRVKEGDDPH